MVRVLFLQDKGTPTNGLKQALESELRKRMEEKTDLRSFVPRYEHLVCVDSDGSVFDTMDLKHMQCFCPLYIEHFGLQSVTEYAKAAWEKVNLRSASRGIHRFRALLQVLDVLACQKEVLAQGLHVPRLEGLRAYISSGFPLHHEGMESYLKVHPQNKDIRSVLAWSRAVDEATAQKSQEALPFSGAKSALERMASVADVVVVSVAPRQVLAQEWQKNALLHTARLICGRESGNKQEIIAALKVHYAEEHVLMIGDAPGDRDAAFANDALFYPICVGEEEWSWREFETYLDAFVRGSYRSEKQNKLLEHFDALLPPIAQNSENKKS